MEHQNTALYDSTSFLSNIAAACNAANQECKKTLKSEEEMVELRRAANRRSAKISRDRKKAEAQDLSKKNTILLNENTQLKHENAELRQQVAMLMKALDERTQTATTNFMMNNTNDNVVESKNNAIVVNNNDNMSAVNAPCNIETPFMKTTDSPPEPVTTTTNASSFDVIDDSSIAQIFLDEEEEQDEPEEEEIKIEPEQLYQIHDDSTKNNAKQLLAQLPFDFESLFQQQQVIMNNKQELFCGDTGPTQAAAMINAALHNARGSVNGFNPMRYGQPNKKRARSA